jgi:hypothetical protein
MNIFLDGPDDVRRLGPVEVEYHHYCGFLFEVFGRPVYPKRFNVLWLVARILYPESFGRKR